jgi:DNA-binding transcriptional LysR family regulator
MKTTISQLRVLEAVARTGSFSKAAQELGITQPSVSTQLRAVETQSRLRLLARNGHKIKVTAFGDTVLPKVRALLTIMDEIEQLLDNERNLRTGLLRLGYSTDQFAMPVISRYMRAYPGVKLETRCMASLDVVELLAKGRIDAAFVTAKAPPANLVAERLRTDPIVIMVPADHPLAGRDAVTWKDLADHTILGRETTSGTRIIFDKAAARACADLKPLVTLGSWESMRAGVMAGMGVGIALLGEVEAGDRIRTVRIEDRDLWASHYLVCGPQMREAAAVEGLFDIAAGFCDAAATKELI